MRRLAVRLHVRVRRRDSGRAIVEFLVVGLLVLVPVVYFVVTLARVQAAAFAVSTASREAGRAFTTATTEGNAYVRAEAAARRDHRRRECLRVAMARQHRDHQRADGQAQRGIAVRQRI